MSPERRLTLALLLSLLIHTSLLTLTFGGEGLWLPGFGFPWQDRRVEDPDLRVALVPAPVTAAEPAVTQDAEPLQQTSVEQPVVGGPATRPSVPRPPSSRTTTAAIVPEASTKTETDPGTDAVTAAAPANTPLRADRTGDIAGPPLPAPPVIALPPSEEPSWVVPAIPMPAPVITTAPSASSPENATPSVRDAGDAARAENARLEAEREEAARKASAEREAVRQEAARQEAARADEERQEATRRVEGARQEAARQEAAQREAARAEAEREEAARQATAMQEAARQEATRQEAARVEAERQEAARKAAAAQEAAQESARQEAAKGEAARVDAAQEANARREAARQAMGRQLDEEAARREAATGAGSLPPSLAPPSSSGRRYWLFGRTDPDAELILYAEAWERKIQQNMTFDMVREAAKLPHTDPMVTVAIRSDGSVESVTFVRSSGVATIDEAIRRIVRSQEHFQAFPPRLAREYDVIHIRRTWYFDMAIRLY